VLRRTWSAEGTFLPRKTIPTCGGATGARCWRGGKGSPTKRTETASLPNAFSSGDGDPNAGPAEARILYMSLQQRSIKPGSRPLASNDARVSRGGVYQWRSSLGPGRAASRFQRVGRPQH